MTLTIKVGESELSLYWHTGLAKECLDTAKMNVKLVMTEDTWFQVVCIVFTADALFRNPAGPCSVATPSCRHSIRGACAGENGSPRS